MSLCQTVSQSDCSILFSHHQYVKVPVYILANTFCCFFHYSHSSECYCNFLDVSHKKIFTDWFKKEYAFVFTFISKYGIILLLIHLCPLSQKIYCIVIPLDQGFSTLALLISCAGWFVFLLREVYVHCKIFSSTSVLYHRCHCHLQLWQLKLCTSIAKSPLGAEIAPGWKLYCLRERNKI